MSETALQSIPQTVPVKFSQQFLVTTPQIVHLLPRDVPLDQFQAGLWMEFTMTPKLRDCTPASLIAATVKAAMKGHVPGRDCFFLPFKNKGVLEATMVEYYQGIVRALDRTGRVEWAKAEPVYARDHFLCDELAERYEFQRHIDGERGKLRCYFSAVKLKGVDKPLVRVCTVEDVEKVRSKAPGNEQDPWLKWPEEMGKKTALKKHAKYLQLVPEEEELIPAVNHSALLFGGDDAEQARLRAVRPSMAEAQTQASVAAILTAPDPLEVPISPGASPAEWKPPVPQEAVTSSGVPALAPPLPKPPGVKSVQQIRQEADAHVKEAAATCQATPSDIWDSVKALAPKSFKLQRQQDLDTVVELLPQAVALWVEAHPTGKSASEPGDDIAPPVLTLDTWLAETARGKGGTADDVRAWLREHDSRDLFGQAAGLDPFAELPECLDQLNAILEEMPGVAALENWHTPT